MSGRRNNDAGRGGAFHHFLLLNDRIYKKKCAHRDTQIDRNTNIGAEETITNRIGKLCIVHHVYNVHNVHHVYNVYNVQFLAG